MKRVKKHGGGSNWMDTYGDMVTLLLCFFVLLYSISTVDQQKWIQLVQSFNPEAVEINPEPAPSTGPIVDPVEEPGFYDELQAQQDEVDAALDLLYQKMEAYIQSQEGAGKNISVARGDGYMFISFNDAVFFAGDSYVLQPDGKTVLDMVSGLLNECSGVIDEVKILGHTAQARPDSPNIASVDRFLSSNRATEVLLYLQEHTKIEPSRLLSIGYGQWRPVSGNGTAEERAKNRRVEILVTGLNLTDALGDSVSQYYTQRTTEETTTPTP